jgi:exopolyphosphatase/guanosine-5'-triphosphate,3'-diphosphate pyrophosphatase
MNRKTTTRRSDRPSKTKTKRTRRTTSAKEAETSKARLLGTIDVGSNSIRLAVVEVRPDGSWTFLEELQQPVRLGVDTFAHGAISPDSMRATCEVINQFKDVLATYRVDTVRAVATSAVREADNRDTFIDRVAQETGIGLETIEAVEESSLTFSYLRNFLGDRHGFDDGGLVIDIGAGSVEIMLVRGGNLVFSESQRTGTLRLLQLLGGASERRALQILGPFIQQNINIFGRVHPLCEIETLFVNCPLAARAFADTPGVEWSGAVAHLAPDRLREIAREAYGLDANARAGRFDIRASEAEELLPSLMIIERFLDLACAERVVVFDVSMIDCLIHDMTSAGADRDRSLEFEQQVRSGAKFIGEKYHFDREHHEHVTWLTLALFDALEDLHGLGPHARLLLETAGILHDIGIYVSTRAHHKHSAYLVAASEIAGLSEDDIRIVSNVVRYHRKAMPKAAHTEYNILSRDDRLMVSKLSAILRIADALDRSHRRRIKSLRVELTPSEMVLWAESHEELSIEEWALPAKADFFKSLYGLEVVLRRDR